MHLLSDMSSHSNVGGGDGHSFGALGHLPWLYDSFFFENQLYDSCW